MEIKKSKGMDLERGRTVRLAVALIAVTALFLLMLEISFDSRPQTQQQEQLLPMPGSTELPPVNIIEEVPMVAEKVKTDIADQLNIVDNETVVETDHPELEEETASDTEENTGEFADEVQQTDLLQDSLKKDTEFHIAEQLPQFPGGHIAFIQWLTKRLHYPAAAKRDKIEGRVTALFIVEPDGSISDLRIGESLHPACDKEALRVLKLMPRWQAGMTDNQPCRTQVCIPIVFKKS